MAERRIAEYAPELNDIEHVWRDLKRHFLAHQTFRDLDHLDRAIHAAVDDLNKQRQSKTCANLRIAALVVTCAISRKG